MAAKKATTKPTTIDWKKLRHATGPAPRVPKLIANLTATDDNERGLARATLDEMLYAPGQWFSASAPTAALLCDVLEGLGEHRFAAGQLLADVLAGGHLHALAHPESLSDKGATAVHAVICQRVQALIRLLDSRDAATCAAVAQTLAFAPSLADGTLPALRTRLTKERDPSARASMLLALATLHRATRSTADAATFSDARTEASPLVRGAAALGILLLEPARAVAEFAGDLSAFLSIEPGTSFGWGGQSLVRLLIAVLDARQDLTDALLNVDITVASPRARQDLADTLLTLSGLKAAWGEEDIALPEELTPVQWRVAEALARVDGVCGIGWGIPASGRVRRRWIGLEPPGPLEMPVAAKRDAPLWRLWRAEYDGAATGIPDVVRKHLAPVELLEALAEMELRAYWIKTDEKPEAHEILKVAESVGASGADWAERFGREMLPYFDGSSMTPENGDSLTPGEWRYLIFIPLMRAKRAIPDEFAIYAPPAPPSLWRESLTHLSARARERAVVDSLAWDGAGAEDEVANAAAVLDLVPSERVAFLLASKLLDGDMRRDLGEREADKMLAQVAKLAKKEPSVRAGLARALEQRHVSN